MHRRRREGEQLDCPLVLVNLVRGVLDETPPGTRLGHFDGELLLVVKEQVGIWLRKNTP